LEVAHGHQPVQEDKAGIEMGVDDDENNGQNNHSNANLQVDVAKSCLPVHEDAAPPAVDGNDKKKEGERSREHSQKRTNKDTKVMEVENCHKKHKP
jgi:hypothetical protein